MIRRLYLRDLSFVESSLARIEPDRWRPHGVRYRLAWVQNGVCRVLFDNHHGKKDHKHIDGEELDYGFRTIHQLRLDFEHEVRKLGGPL